MAKTTTLRGTIILKENTRSESLTDRILSVAADGTITDRPAISSSGFVSSTLPSAQIIVGNVSNVATAVAMSGVIAISNTGVTSIVDGSIVNADINASAAIAYSKLNLSGGIVNADVNASAAIVYSKLNLTGGILNADINSAAAIARSKTASGTAYRILANTSAGVMSENAALTAARVIVSDANGQLIAATPTTTEINRVSGVTSPIQTQINTIIAGNATNALIQSPTAGEDGYAITWDDGSQEWTLTDPVVQGIPVAGSTRQFLGKNSGTNYDADWLDLVIDDITDITATAAELNILDGATVTVDEINHLSGSTSSIQDQLNNKLSNSLAENALFLGNSSNTASQLASGTNGQVLQIVGSTPQWQTIVGTGTVTSIDVSGGATGLTFSGGPVTASGTITMSGTLDANNGGTGFSAYTVGDVLYADTTSTLAKLGIGSDGEVLTLAGGVPTWAASSGSIADGDYGDVTVSGTGTALTVDANINKAWTGTHSFVDNVFTILDNVDPTKKLAFQVSGVAGGTTRTLTVPDLSGTIALLGASGNGAALTKVDDTNVTLTLGGNPNQSLLTATSVTVGWAGQLSVIRGGTGLSTTAQGDILYADASNSLASLPKNTTATRYLANTGTSNNPAWAQVNVTNGVTGVLDPSNGGTGVANNTASTLTISGNFATTLTVSGVTGVTLPTSGTLATVAGTWATTGTSTLTGVATITSNAASQHIFNGTWTASANSQFHTDFTGAFTARATTSDTLTGYRFTPTLVAGAATQVLNSVSIIPTFTAGVHNPTTIPLYIGDSSTNTYIRFASNAAMTTMLMQFRNNGGTLQTLRADTAGNNMGVSVGWGATRLEFSTSIATSAVTDTAAPSIFRQTGTSGASGLIISSAAASSGNLGIEFRSIVSGLTTGTTPVAGIGTTTDFTVSSGTANLTLLKLNPTVGTSGSYAGILAGFEHDPVINSSTGLTHKAWRHTSGWMQWDSVLSPAQITANTDDYNPTGWNNGGAPHGATILRLSTDASRNLTSLTGGLSGRIVIIANVGAQDLVIKDDDGATGTAGNRFQLNADITLQANKSLMFFYDAVSSRWRALSN